MQTETEFKITKCQNKYAGKCRACQSAVAPREGVYLKGALACLGCLLAFAGDVATFKEDASWLTSGAQYLKPVNRTGIPTGLLYWVLRQNGIQGYNRMRQRWERV